MFDFYPDEKGTDEGYLYEDDGETTAYKSGAYRTTKFRARFDEGENICIAFLAHAGDDEIAVGDKPDSRHLRVSKPVQLGNAVHYLLHCYYLRIFDFCLFSAGRRMHGLQEGRGHIFRSDWGVNGPKGNRCVQVD